VILPTQCPPRPLRRSGTLVAGLNDGCAASSATTAAATVPRARFRAQSSAQVWAAGRAGAVCRWLPSVVGRTFPAINRCR
jgi:hypothetical protein